MFFILDLTSNETIESSNVGTDYVSIQKQPQPHQQSQTTTTKSFNSKSIILGSTTRSRNGCLQCRKRKKKCDESYPVCGSCKHRKVECTWRNGTQFKILKPTHTSITSDSGKKQIKTVSNKPRAFSVPSISTPSSNCSTTLGTDNTDSYITTTAMTRSMSDSITNECSAAAAITEMARSISDTTNNESNSNIPIPEESSSSAMIMTHSPLQFPTDSSSFPMPANLDMLVTDNYNYDFLFPSPSISHIFSPFKYMDDKAQYFLDGYINKVARNLCIGPDSSNYFLKTFYQLAEQDMSILYLLTAWGGLFIEGYTDEVKSYMKKSFRLMEESERYPINGFNNNKKLSSEDIYILLNFFLIGIGVHICAGDISKWPKLFNKAIEMIQKNGGLLGIVEMFDYSNDIKWLISDVQFHDIMSSRGFSKGTIFPMKEYDRIFNQNKILELDNYGLDPFQGCIQPIFLLLGEISSVAAGLKERKREMEMKLNLGDDCDEYEEGDCDLLDERLQFYQEATAQYEYLHHKLEQCKPNINQMETIMNDKPELELHLTLFEVYLYTCQLCMNYQIRQIPPRSMEMQAILLNALNCIDILMDTKMLSTLSFLLLICGITCYTKRDRLKMKQRFETIINGYKCANVKRMYDIMNEVWKRNEDGRIYIDWIEICQENNWQLSVG